VQSVEFAESHTDYSSFFPTPSQLKQKESGHIMSILNTHTQSNTEISWLFGPKQIIASQKQQFQQICKYVEGLNHPAILTGDLNCERSPHPHVRFLLSPLMKKHTFPPTGEDLDHIAWFPLQYAQIVGCGFCDIDRKGPFFETCEVFDIPYSDHNPVIATVQIPSL
jgi:endonuclease/exonuclease/phosphatase (EEP) superfamily protein YafD